MFSEDLNPDESIIIWHPGSGSVPNPGLWIKGSEAERNINGSTTLVRSITKQNIICSSLNLGLFCTCPYYPPSVQYVHCNVPSWTLYNCIFIRYSCECTGTSSCMLQFLPVSYCLLYSIYCTVYCICCRVAGPTVQYCLYCISYGVIITECFSCRTFKDR